jgi:thiamine transporter ThiT
VLLPLLLLFAMRSPPVLVLVRLLLGQLQLLRAQLSLEHQHQRLLQYCLAQLQAAPFARQCQK